MTTLRMGFCGGCLSHQRDIPLNQLFYRILSRRLAEQYGVEVRLVISRHFEARAPERVAQLVKDGIDLLVLHVRSLPAVPNARWIAKEVSGGKARLRLNSRFVMARRFPALGRLKLDYPLPPAAGAGSDNLAEDSYSRGSLANQINVAAGLILGVASEAIQETLEDTLAALHVIRDAGVPFFVMGPPPSTQAGLPGRMVCERLNRAMRRSSALLGFPYVDLFPGWDDGYLMWDGLHLNSGGHRHIAERLRVEIGEGITAVARQREAPSP